MINFLYRMFLTFNSTSLLIVVFFVKEQTVIDWKSIDESLACFPNAVSYFIYFLIPVFLTLISLFWARLLDDDSIENQSEKSRVTEVEQANNAFLPSYLGYFFVALSVPYCETLYFIFIVLFVFTFFSQTLYFNPLFLICRYQFYYLTTSNGVKVFIITKKSLKDPSKIDLPRLKRINDFTFIDMEK